MSSVVSTVVRSRQTAISVCPARMSIPHPCQKTDPCRRLSHPTLTRCFCCAGMGICAQDQELAAAAVNMNKVRLAARHPTGYAVLASKRARASVCGNRPPVDPRLERVEARLFAYMVGAHTRSFNFLQVGACSVETGWGIMI